MTPFPRALGGPTAPLSPLQPRGAARRGARVMGCLDRPSSRCPLLACIHPIHISVRHIRDRTANVAVAGMTTVVGLFIFLFCPRCILHFSCHFSSPAHEKAEFLEQILVCNRRRTLCACGVQLPLCARQSHPGPAGVRCAGRALGRGGEGRCQEQVQKHTYTSDQQDAFKAKYRALGWDASKIP